MTTLVGFAAPTYSNDVSESAGSLTHNLTLSAPSSQTVTVTVRGSSSTSAGFAGSADLGVADQVITFAPGQTTAAFTTAIYEDALYEGNEFYSFQIISATGAEIDLTNTNARYLSGNILDNDQLEASNAPPVITSNGGGNTAAVSILENTTAVTTVTATDPDVGQNRNYSIIGGADASKFTIGATTGALSFITAPNFELPTDAGGNNVYDVIVQASDGYGGIDTQAIAVTVTDVFDMAKFTLTTGSNTVTGTAGDDTVYGTAATLNSGDSLTGGAGLETPRSPAVVSSKSMRWRPSPIGLRARC